MVEVCVFSDALAYIARVLSQYYYLDGYDKKACVSIPTSLIQTHLTAQCPPHSGLTANL